VGIAGSGRPDRSNFSTAAHHRTRDDNLQAVEAVPAKRRCEIWEESGLNSRARIFAAVGWLALLTAAGTIGFAWIEELPWFDALYFTVVTFSTVGFGDVAPQTRAGQIFTTGLIIMGVGTALYLVSVIAEDVLEGRLRNVIQRRSMMRKISKHRGHVIVCGYGRFGKAVIDELVRAGRTVVVVERSTEQEAVLGPTGLDYIIGSATHDEILEQAGTANADAIVVATSTEADNVFITLSARELNPKLKIHARGESEASIRRLRRAGADYVNSPLQTGGLRTAASILRPSVVDFLELSLPSRGEEIDLEEIRVGEGSAASTIEVGEIERRNQRLRVVALKRVDQPIQLVPGPGERVEAGDHLVVIGEREQLSQLAREAIATDS
jgi:voltage-gated potassium channel